MSRAIYRSLLWLHPAAFRDRFAAEMLWLYDETVSAEGAAALLADGLNSLIRRWLIRRLTWKLAAAVAGGLLEVGLVLALSRDVYSSRARAASRVSVAEAASSLDSGALASGRSATQNPAADPLAGVNPASPQAAPVSAIPVGDAPLAFAVLFGIVFVYACQRRRFELRDRGVPGASRHLSRDRMRESSARPKPRLSIIAD
jgi:hypothetical protein